MLDRTPGRIKHNATVYPCVDLRLDRLMMAEQAQHSGLRMPTNVMVAGAELPVLRATMPLKTAHTLMGLVNLPILAATVLEAVLANVVAGAIDTNNTHVKYAKSTNCFACAWIDSFSVAEGGEALAEVMIPLFSNDGSADPVTRTNNVALPALTAIPENHGIGPLVLNTSAIDGVTGIQYQSGFGLSVQRISGKPYITGGVPSGFKPTLTIEHQDADAIFAAIGAGATISGTTTVALMKYANDILSASGQMLLTIAAGYIRALAAGGKHGEHFKGGVEILGSSSDGSANPIAVS